MLGNSTVRPDASDFLATFSISSRHVSTSVARRAFLKSAAASILVAQLPFSASAFAADLPISADVGRPASRITHQSIRVFTNRQPTGSRDPANQFGYQRGRPSFVKAKVELTTLRGARIPVASETVHVNRVDEQVFLSPPKQGSSDSHNAILFVHGYNYSFDDAVKAGAFLKAVIGTDATMFVQSWPAWAGYWGLAGYIHDMGEIDFAIPLLRQTLSNLLRSSSIDHVQIIAHSMGARALVTALKAILDSSEKALLKQITEVVLAAPDVEQEVMDRDYMPVVEYAGFDTCLYVSNRDWAMWVSEGLNGTARAGSTKEIYIRKSISTIEVNLIDTSTFGHSSIFESRRLASDMHYFLNHRMPAKNRYGLRKKQIYSGSYWCMEP